MKQYFGPKDYAEKFSDELNNLKKRPNEQKSLNNEHVINIEPRAPIINLKPYRRSVSEKEKIDTKIKKMEKDNIIRKSNSSYSFSIVMVKKKDGGSRFCIDYRMLNKYTVKDVFFTTPNK